MSSRCLAWALIILLPSLGAIEVLRRPNANIEAGNAALKSGNAQAALGFFEKATQTGGIDPGVQLNVGLALSALGKHDEATQAFLQASGARDTTLKATAFYNLGNGFFRGEKWAEAIEAYKRSLTLAPKNANAKWNLEIALQKKVDQDKKDQDKQDQDKKDPDKQDQDKKDPDKQD
ncbi:MAG: tetratricopeptide repeat protein, partial [Deltaproteobacteria bacterium]|nr:tetratricopeptide repeat protein [Deltaproteobacteria bacterium]